MTARIGQQGQHRKERTARKRTVRMTSRERQAE
jgi:hypothetical protein